MKPILSTREAAEILGTDAEKVRRWCREEYLPAVKIGREYRISTAALMDWWEEKGGGRLVLNEDRLINDSPFSGLRITKEKSKTSEEIDEEKSKTSTRKPRRIIQR